MSDPTNILIGREERLYAKGRRRLIVKLFLSLGLIGLVLFLIDLQEIVEILANLNLRYLLPVVLLIYVNRILMAYKWNLLLQAIGVRAPFFFLFQIYAIAPLSGSLVPSSIGGDIFRVYSLSRYQSNTKAILASIIVERGLGFIAVLMLSMVSLALVTYLIKDAWIYYLEIVWILVVGAIITVGLIGVTHSFLRKTFCKTVSRFTAHPIIRKLYEMYLLLCEYRNHSRTVVAVSAWTFLEQALPLLIITLMARALHMSVSFLEVIAIVPLILLAVRLPISLDIFGVQESLYIALFGLVSVSPSEAFILSTVGRVVTLICALPWGIYYIFAWRQDNLIRSAHHQQETVIRNLWR